MKGQRRATGETITVTVEAEIGWDGRLLGPARVLGGTHGENSAAALLAADRVDELRLTLLPRLGDPDSADRPTGTLTDGNDEGGDVIFPPRGSTAWRLVRMSRGAGGVCRLRYVRQRETTPA